jgi:LytS/YehU family sensor histidine kinase
VNLALSLFLSGQLGSFSLSFEVLRTSWTGMFQSHLVIYWGILGLCIGWDSHTRMRDQQLRAAELERELLQARIGALRNQLHPHFLFNALNAISAHVEATPRTARRMLEELGGLLRLSLSHLEDPEISLEEEVEFIERYLGLQQARFGERLRVTIAIDPNAIGARVPTFLLEPLVENAIRHGVALRSEPGHVEITVRKHRNRLRLQVADDGPGLPPGWNIEKGNGIGLRNTRDRLEYLYGVDQVFRVSGIEDSGVLVEIEIPCQSSADVDEVRK